jgi:hypothetical protein
MQRAPGKIEKSSFCRAFGPIVPIGRPIPAGWVRRGGQPIFLFDTVFLRHV